jgi:hypothetical protein
VQIHIHYTEYTKVTRCPEGSMLTSDRVADGQAGASRATLGEDEEAVAGGTETAVVVKPANVLKQGVGGPVIEGEDVTVAGAAIL